MTEANIISSVIAFLSLVTASVAIFTLRWQRVSFRRQKIDDKFYQLLNIHRQNVEGMKLGGLENREIFKGLYYELTRLIRFLNNYLEINTDIQINYKDRINLAYKIFFYGDEYNNTSKELEKLIPNYEERKKLQDAITAGINESKEPSGRDDFRQRIEETYLAIYTPYLGHSQQLGHYYRHLYRMYRTVKNEHKKRLSGKDDFRQSIGETYLALYTPYLGHSQQLGHYYRHLYRTVKFVDGAKIDETDKKEYIKTLRAQLSDYEQLMFYANALSELGAEWFKNGENSLIVRYELIKNIPLPLAFGYSPKNKFAEIGVPDEQIENYFEWDERQKP